MTTLRQALGLIWQRLLEGGVYMFPIFLVSVAMFALIVHHLHNYIALRRSLGSLRRPGGRPPVGPLAGMVAQYHRSRGPVPELNIRLREELTRNFLSRSGAEGRSILLCGSVAMLMGLLGTVSGMINTFEAIQIFGVGNTRSFAAGISEALLTTQSGLLVGVTGFAFGHSLRRLHKKLQIKLSRYFEEVENRPAAGRREEYHG
ncbi:MAG: MotA/TolQ/ExbB proton channel family protein [Planctomycetes bacterium]|nr:MotA/TolQ/ExbB proton channel family protein [Planctomycetota bacterium]